MNENTKTGIFVAAAAALLLTAWIIRPKPYVDDPTSDVGSRFFLDFTDPLAATELEVLDYDEATATPRRFEVAQVNQVWSIPSHENYPADAARHLEEAATSVMQLEKLGIASDDPSTHELYGVVDPENPSTGAKGVGKRVVLRDKGDKVLAEFIFGKEVEDQPGLRYVRRPGQDRVYAVKVDTAKLSTRFQDWIEKDLLKLNAWDIKDVVLKDHSVDELQRQLILRDEITASYDDQGAKWTVEEIKEFNPDTSKWTEVALAGDEELDAAKLNELKNALDDLQIVDVIRKPQGLSADLRGDEKAIENQEAAQALAARGFFFAPTPEGGYELFSKTGEIRCGTKDGVEYILRFGEIAGQGKAEDDAPSADEKPEGAAADTADAKGAEGEEKSGDVGLNRYILVTTRFNQDLIPKPEFETPPGGAQPAAAPGPAAPAEGAPAAEGEKKPAEGESAPAAVTKPAEAPAAEAEKPAAPQGGAAIIRSDAASLADTLMRAGAELAFAQDAQEAAAAAAQPAAEKPAEEKPAEQPAAPAADATQPAAAEAKETPAGDTPPKTDDAAAQEKAQMEAERMRIEESNKRKQEQYDAQVKKGQERVKELNDRFADWYYVISDKTYRKVRLSRNEIVKKKEIPAGEGNGVQDLDALKNLQGVTPPASAVPTP